MTLLCDITVHFADGQGNPLAGEIAYGYPQYLGMFLNTGSGPWASALYGAIPSLPSDANGDAVLSLPRGSQTNPLNAPYEVYLPARGGVGPTRWAGVVPELTSTDLFTLKESFGWGLVGTSPPIEFITGAPGLNPRGVWSPSVTYNPHDVVFDNGSSYYALAINLNSEPSTTNTNWQALSLASVAASDSVVYPDFYGTTAVTGLVVTGAGNTISQGVSVAPGTGYITGTTGYARRNLAAPVVFNSLQPNMLNFIFWNGNGGLSGISCQPIPNTAVGGTQNVTGAFDANGHQQGDVGFALPFKTLTVSNITGMVVGTWAVDIPTLQFDTIASITPGSGTTGTVTLTNGFFSATVPTKLQQGPSVIPFPQSGLMPLARVLTNSTNIIAVVDMRPVGAGASAPISVDFRQFGAVGDDTTDCSPAWNLAMQYAYNNVNVNQGGVSPGEGQKASPTQLYLHVPVTNNKHVYRFLSPLTMPSDNATMVLTQAGAQTSPTPSSTIASVGGNPAGTSLNTFNVQAGDGSKFVVGPVAITDLNGNTYQNWINTVTGDTINLANNVVLINPPDTAIGTSWTVSQPQWTFYVNRNTNMGPNNIVVLGQYTANVETVNIGSFVSGWDPTYGGYKVTIAGTMKYPHPMGDTMSTSTVTFGSKQGVALRVSGGVTTSTYQLTMTPVFNMAFNLPNYALMPTLTASVQKGDKVIQISHANFMYPQGGIPIGSALNKNQRLTLGRSTRNAEERIVDASYVAGSLTVPLSTGASFNHSVGDIIYCWDGATADWKMDCRAGSLEVDHIVLGRMTVDATDTMTMLGFTSGVGNVHDVQFYTPFQTHSTSYTWAPNNGIAFGGLAGTASGPSGSVGAYTSWVQRCRFFGIKTLVTAQSGPGVAASNSIKISDIWADVSCGDPMGPAFVLNNSDANYIRDCAIEQTNYKYFAQLFSAQGNVIGDNTFWDDKRYTQLYSQYVPGSLTINPPNWLPNGAVALGNYNAVGNVGALSTTVTVSHPTYILSNALGIQPGAQSFTCYLQGDVTMTPVALPVGTVVILDPGTSASEWVIISDVNNTFVGTTDKQVGATPGARFTHGLNATIQQQARPNTSMGAGGYTWLVSTAGATNGIDSNGAIYTYHPISLTGQGTGANANGANVGVLIGPGNNMEWGLSLAASTQVSANVYKTNISLPPAVGPSLSHTLGALVLIGPFTASIASVIPYALPSTTYTSTMTAGVFFDATSKGNTVYGGAYPNTALVMPLTEDHNGTTQQNIVVAAGVGGRNVMGSPITAGGTANNSLEVQAIPGQTGLLVNVMDINKKTAWSLDQFGRQATPGITPLVPLLPLYGPAAVGTQGVADPTIAPIVQAHTDTVNRNIPPGTYYFGYSYANATGGETDLSPLTSLTLVNTAPAGSPPAPLYAVSFQGLPSGVSSSLTTKLYMTPAAPATPYSGMEYSNVSFGANQSQSPNPGGYILNAPVPITSILQSAAGPGTPTAPVSTPVSEITLGGSITTNGANGVWIWLGYSYTFGSTETPVGGITQYVFGSAVTTGQVQMWTAGPLPAGADGVKWYITQVGNFNVLKQNGPVTTMVPVTWPTWSSSAAYAINDIVTDPTSPKLWRAKASSGPTATVPSEGANWTASNGSVPDPTHPIQIPTLGFKLSTATYTIGQILGADPVAGATAIALVRNGTAYTGLQVGMYINLNPNALTTELVMITANNNDGTYGIFGAGTGGGLLNNHASGESFALGTSLQRGNIPGSLILDALFTSGRWLSIDAGTPIAEQVQITATPTTNGGPPTTYTTPTTTLTYLHQPGAKVISGYPATNTTLPTFAGPHAVFNSANDVRGHVSVTTSNGGTFAAGLLFTILFSNPYTVFPTVTVTPENSAAQALGIYTSILQNALGTGGIGINVFCNNPPAANAVYPFSYMVYS